MGQPIIHAIDNGYHYTKDNELNIYKSAITRSDNSLTGDNKISVNGINYYFGKGDITADIDKSDSMINKICTLSSLSMKGSGEYYLVVGLPISQYHTKKDKFKQTVMNYNESEVVYKDKLIKIQINDVTVFAQGAGVLFNYQIPDAQYIIFDVGSYTINVVLVDLINGIPHIIKYDTWYNGILNLYGNIINAVNQKFDITLDMMESENILKRGLNVNGTNQNMNFLNDIKQEYLDNILTKFKLRYNYATTPILICGGGGSLLQSMIEGEFNNSILIPDSQFANAIGYYNFGLQKYGGVL